MSAQHLAELGVVVVAAGRGERFGAKLPKAFVEIRGETLLERSARTVVSLPYVGHLVLVVPEGHASEALEIAEVAEGTSWRTSVVTGGRERHESVRKGLEALSDSVSTVLVHDAARPLTPSEVFERVIMAVQEHSCGIVPAVPPFDTMKMVDDTGLVLATADRDHLVAAQTPQGFPRELLTAAHQTAQLQGASSPIGFSTDDADVVQRAGGTVRTVPGSPFAHKLTTPADLRVLEALLGSEPQ